MRTASNFSQIFFMVYKLFENTNILLIYYGQEPSFASKGQQGNCHKMAMRF